MDLKTVGIILLIIAISSMAIHFVLELFYMFKVEKWISKNKPILLLEKNIQDKYLTEVVKSQDYIELKQIYEEAPFIFKKASSIGLNYLDLYFFQKIMGEYYKNNIMKDDNLLQQEEQTHIDIFNRLKKVIWIVLGFNISRIFKNIGLYFSKFTIVYLTVLFIYDKLF